MLPLQEKPFLDYLANHSNLNRVHQSLVGESCQSASDYSVGQLMYKIAFLTGFHGSINDETIKLTADYIRRNLKGYKLNEIVVACEMDIAGDFGETKETFNNISPKYLNQLIQRYDTHVKQQYLKAFHRFNNAEPELTDEQKAELAAKFNERLRIDLNAVIRGENEKVKLPVHTYRFLCDMGLISLNTERKNQYLEQAKEEYIMRLKDLMQEKSERIRNKNIIDSIQSGVLSDDTQMKIIAISKELIINDFIIGCGGKEI